MTETKITPAPPKAAMIEMSETGLQLRTLDDAFRFAQYVVASGLAPQGDTPEKVLMKVQAGAELGFSPMRSLSALVVVNGKLSMEGQTILALCRASGKFKKLRTWNEGDGDARSGCVEFVRADTGETDTVRFSVADAKRAGLMGKDTYKSYPDDMILWKAVSRFGKRYASDVMFGIDAAEVVADYRPVTENVEAPSPRALPPADTTPDPIFDADESARLDAEIVASEK